MTIDITTPDVIGTIGTVLLIIAYYMLQAGKVRGDNWSYMLMNLIGAALILFSLIFDFNFAAFTIEIFWVGISAYGIWRKLKSKSLENS